MYFVQELTRRVCRRTCISTTLLTLGRQTLRSVGVNRTFVMFIQGLSSHPIGGVLPPEKFYPPNQALLTPPSGVVYHEVCVLY